MSDQWKNRIVIVTTGILLFSFSIACLLKPSDAVSLSERRPLTQFPSISDFPSKSRETVEYRWRNASRIGN